MNLLCRMLQVSRSGYYAWRDRPASLRQQRRDELVRQIRRAHDQSRGAYGSPRVTVDLKEAGVNISRNTVAKYMVSARPTTSPRR